MLWCEDEIHSHLTTIDKKYKKECRELFKQIQIYMTNRVSNNVTQDEIGLNIIQLGHSKRKVFGNEIYCQLIKQLTNNPNTIN